MTQYFSKEVKNAWEKSKSVETNFAEMGLSHNPNKTIKIPNSKKEMKVSLLSNENEWDEELIPEFKEESAKHLVAKILENDARAPREKNFRLPKSQVEWLTYLMKKYKNNFKAMALDKKNYNQETWKQIRQKIRRFMLIPQQFNKFVKENGDYDLEKTISDDEL